MEKKLSVALVSGIAVSIFVVSTLVGFSFPLLFASSSAAQSSTRDSVSALPAAKQTCPTFQGLGTPSYCVRITLSNDQSAPTGSNLQILLSVDWNRYMSHLAPNVRNVEFTDRLGKPLFAWCESNCGSSQIYSKVWIKDDHSIAAFGTQKIYLWIFPTSTNEYSSLGFWGAYPTFTSTYGQYDNGPRVFTFYNNFNGTSLCSCMSTFGKPAFTVNNGLTVSTSNCYGCGIQTKTTYSPNVTFDSLTRAAVGSYYMNIGPEQTSTINQNGVVTGYADSGLVLLITQRGGTQQYTLSQSEPSGYAIWTDSWTTSRAYQQLNYGSQLTTSSDIPKIALPWTLLVWIGNSASISAGWTRIRIFPPNNVLPLASFGPLTPY